MGNHDDIDLLTENACRILEWAKASTVKVYKGEAKPLVRFSVGGELRLRSFEAWRA